MFGIDTWLEQWLHSSATLGAVLLVSIVLGLRHASDPDHLAAVTALIVTEHRTDALRRAGLMGLSWGLGHATTLLLLGLPLLLLDQYLPQTIQQAVEVAVGGLIIWLSLRLLLRWRYKGVGDQADSLARGNLHVHKHHDSGGAHADRTAWGAYGVGLLHGAGGTGGVTLLLLSRVPDPFMATTALLLFALGTVVSMALVMTGFGLILSTRPVVRRFHQIAPVLSVLSFGFGVVYIYHALI